MASISIRDIEIRFEAFQVLQGLDLEINSGEFIVLLGPSGCGKSTLLNAIAGLIDVADGEIWIGERNVTWEEPSDRNIGMVFQSYALYPRMTVEGNLSFGLRMAGVAKAEIEKRIARAAQILRIEPYLKRRPSELSGGQRQRVAIGRALVRDVGVFLFDEPLSNLDAKLRTELRVELKRLHQELGTTMVFVTHDQIEALTLADRIAVMNGGIIQQFDTPDDVYRRPNNRFVAEFVGSPAMNFFDGTVVTRGRSIGFEVRGGPTLDLDGYAFASRPTADARASLGIRPEQISLSKSDRSVSMPAIVNLVEPMGSDKLLWATAADTTMSLRTAPDFEVPLRQPIDVFFQASQASLFGENGERL
ncbi:multiple sugar transport system ATP-binding protein [Rhizobium sp. BK313]|uniref:ABC transporter ATP-binding protein n=1 Tax=Rhizobium sp. BK313 TaxID=2587081 RepID=UPI00105E7027|nr:sn-glycerol-3-phosphate ABC transporter ATP-binding protein UgpC [Rhizobium sp. BK313]MBB3458185.1 multiple sugar transport system ATP-binding protein [Rhizobium sp. BK313]